MPLRRRQDRVRLITTIMAAAVGLTACTGHPRPKPLPQLASKPTQIAHDPQAGRFRTTLSVLTYNVRGLPWPLGVGRHAAFRQIAADLRQLQAEGRAPDLLLLQEAFTPEAGRIGNRAGYPNWVPGPGAEDRSTLDAPPLDQDFLDDRSFWKGERFGKLLSSGLYLFSVYPILDVRMTPFGANTCAGYDCLANKGVMLAVIAVPGVPAPIQVLNTHLNSRKASGVAPSRSLYAHNRQVDEIRLFLDRHLRPDWPFVYGGDFNSRKSQDRFNHKMARIPGVVVHYYCEMIQSDCDMRIFPDSDAPWLETQDLQGFADGSAVSVRPIRVEAMFDQPRDGEMLSDHYGCLVTYELSWPGPRHDRPMAPWLVDGPVEARRAGP